MIKFLIDENISYRLAKKIEDIFPYSEQVKRLGLLSKEDLIIWKYAKNHDFTILTFDEDFNELSNIYGMPPRVILLKSTENVPTLKIEAVIRKNIQFIMNFHANDFFEDRGCLEIYIL